MKVVSPEQPSWEHLTAKKIETIIMQIMGRVDGINFKDSKSVNTAMRILGPVYNGYNHPEYNNIMQFLLDTWKELRYNEKASSRRY